jgi:hypothetical protein
VLNGVSVFVQKNSVLCNSKKYMRVQMHSWSTVVGLEWECRDRQ